MSPQLLTEVDGHLGARPQRAEVDVLALPGRRIEAGKGRHARREVPDHGDVVLRQEPAAERLEIEPSVRRLLQAPEVQVEAIDVDARAQDGLGRRSGA